jgi:hypothetical protein
MRGKWSGSLKYKSSECDLPTSFICWKLFTPSRSEIPLSKSKGHRMHVLNEGAKVVMLIVSIMCTLYAYPLTITALFTSICSNSFDPGLVKVPSHVQEIVQQSANCASVYELYNWPCLMLHIQLVSFKLTLLRYISNKWQWEAFHISYMLASHHYLFVYFLNTFTKQQCPG